jgi:hypothetical protein
LIACAGQDALQTPPPLGRTTLEGATFKSAKMFLVFESSSKRPSRRCLINPNLSMVLLLYDCEDNLGGGDCINCACPFQPFRTILPAASLRHTVDIFRKNLNFGAFKSGSGPEGVEQARFPFSNYKSKPVGRTYGDLMSALRQMEGLRRRVRTWIAPPINLNYVFFLTFRDLSLRKPSRSRINPACDSGPIDFPEGGTVSLERRQLIPRRWR